METVRYLRQRREYEQDSLLEEEAGLNPFVLFKRWFEESLEAGVPHANAMTLATVSSEGKPSARIVLFKDFGENGFTFFTDYRSTKSEELSRNPHGALVCLWSSLERQIRIEGKDRTNLTGGLRHLFSEPSPGSPARRLDFTSKSGRSQSRGAGGPDERPRPTL